jgi:hypothetical protein
MYYDGQKLSIIVSFDAMGGGETPSVTHVVIIEALRDYGASSLFSLSWVLVFMWSF